MAVAFAGDEGQRHVRLGDVLALERALDENGAPVPHPDVREGLGQPIVPAELLDVTENRNKALKTIIQSFVMDFFSLFLL